MCYDVLKLKIIFTQGAAMTRKAGHVKTEKNVFEAFKAESKARWIYKAFAEEAEKEGNRHIAGLFRAAAASEDIQAHSLLRALQEISRVSNELWVAGLYDPKMVRDSVTENLKEAIGGWFREFSARYPQMIRQATLDGWDFARERFTYANAVERVHVELFKEALQDLAAKTPRDYYVCESCGNTTDRKPVGPCRLCGSSKSAFLKVE
jgi:rubrerythrin